MLAVAKQNLSNAAFTEPTDMTMNEFSEISGIAERDAGLMIAESKRRLVQTRIQARMIALGIKSVSDYLSHIKHPQGNEERGRMVASLTTNVTAFNREPHHFEQLKSEVLPGLIKRARNGGKVRIWSAGCSTGQEAYSVAMALLDLAPDIADFDLLILASDIDTACLEHAANGRYRTDDLEEISETQRSHHFQETQTPGVYAATGELRSIVCFRTLNLFDPWPMRHPFDVVLCRNVVIYFSRERQQKLWAQFCDAMKIGAWLFLGHSERLSGPAQSNFDPAGVTSFQKTSYRTPLVGQERKEVS